jgi:hypothetical protein
MIHTRAFAILLASILFAGCAPKTQTTLKPPPPEPNPEPHLASDARERVKELATLAEEFSNGAIALPGVNAAEDRTQVTHEFELLGQMLPMLNGPDMTGDFRQQLGIVNSSRSLLSTASQDLAVEPTIDTGLRAGHRALTSISQRSFIELTDVSKALETMRTKIEELDGISGPAHRLVTAQAFRAGAEAVTLMSAELDKRLNDAKGKADQGSNAKPAEKKPADAKPADAKPAENKPADQKVQ